MAFIVDLRLENRSLHLLYKALFELSTDRADFVSRLFSRERPSDLETDSSVEDLFTRYASAQPQRRLREENGRLIRERLLATHRFPLSPRELEWIDYLLDAFYADGPDIHYARRLPNDPRGPSYRALMTARDVSGQHRSYLASEGQLRIRENPARGEPDRPGRRRLRRPLRPPTHRRVTFASTGRSSPPSTARTWRSISLGKSPPPSAAT